MDIDAAEARQIDDRLAEHLWRCHRDDEIEVPALGLLDKFRRIDVGRVHDLQAVMLAQLLEREETAGARPRRQLRQNAIQHVLDADAHEIERAIEVMHLAQQCAKTLLAHRRGNDHRLDVGTRLVALDEFLEEDPHVERIVLCNKRDVERRHRLTVSQVTALCPFQTRYMATTAAAFTVTKYNGTVMSLNAIPRRSINKPSSAAP